MNKKDAFVRVQDGEVILPVVLSETHPGEGYHLVQDVMTPEELVDTICILAGEVEHGNRMLCDMEARLRAKDWIPCSERMPEQGVKVILGNPKWGGDSDIGSLSHKFEFWWHGDCDILALGDVTHWMPLPPSPEVKP